MGKALSKFRAGALTALLLTLPGAQAHADTQQALPSTPPEKSAASLNNHPADFAMHDTKRIDFVSKVNGRRYSIIVSLPAVPPPPSGYPVIYVLDGEFYFASFTEAMRSGNAPQVVVVGLGYPHDQAWAEGRVEHFKPVPAFMAQLPAYHQAAGLERWYDLTLPVDEETLQPMRTSGFNMRPMDTGGVDDFLKTIETEVKPRVYALARIDKTDQALFGHSLGGQAVVVALFTEPEAFRTFIAASANMIFGKKTLQAEEEAFSRKVEAGKAAPRVIFTAGGLEETLPKILPPEYEAQRAKLETMMKESGPISLGCALTRRLQALHGAAGYEVADCAVFKDQDHPISVWPALGRAISFAFPR
jgi:predicted alpha/beta superfamily hydrolase